jgi:purine-nucleoside phosphorylase
MSTHIQAEKNAIAERVLLPGDPLRAKYIAETFLDEPILYNTIRNAFGYTGKYKGVPVSIQGTGMGIPSISIYVNELIREYGVKKLFRVGTCGGMSPDVHVRDVILAQGTTTDSGIIVNTFGSGISYAPLADFKLLSSAAATAEQLGITVRVGNVLSEDRFYNDEINRGKLVEYGILATEMEAAGLYTLAAKYKVQALAVLTVSNHLLTNEETTAAERETSFNDMIRLALETAIK